MARKWKFVKWKYFSSRNNFNLRLSKSKKNIFFKPAADSNQPVPFQKQTFDSLLLISPRFGGSDAVGEFFKLEKSVFYVENFERKYLTELENCKINGIRIKNGTENNCGTLPMVIQTFEHFSLEEIDLNRTKILYVIRDPRSLAYDFSKESDNHIILIIYINHLNRLLSRSYQGLKRI